MILLVDDDALFRSSLSLILRKEGLETVEAEDGIDAFRIVQENGHRIDLLLTDVQMPAMDGLALAEAVRRLYPNMPVLLMTGSPAPFSHTLGNCSVLRKP